MAKKGSLVSMFNIIGLCVGLEFFLQANGIARFGGLNVFF